MYGNGNKWCGQIHTSRINGMYIDSSIITSYKEIIPAPLLVRRIALLLMLARAYSSLLPTLQPATQPESSSPCTREGTFFILDFSAKRLDELHEFFGSFLKQIFGACFHVEPHQGFGI